MTQMPRGSVCRSGGLRSFRNGIWTGPNLLAFSSRERDLPSAVRGWLQTFKGGGGSHLVAERKTKMESVYIRLETPRKGPWGRDPTSQRVTIGSNGGTLFETNLFWIDEMRTKMHCALNIGEDKIERTHGEEIGRQTKARREMRTKEREGESRDATG